MNTLEKTCFWKMMVDSEPLHSESLDYCEQDCDGTETDCKSYLPVGRDYTVERYMPKSSIRGGE